MYQARLQLHINSASVCINLQLPDSVPSAKLCELKAFPNWTSMEFVLFSFFFFKWQVTYGKHAADIYNLVTVNPKVGF